MADGSLTEGLWASPTGGGVTRVPGAKPISFHLTWSGSDDRPDRSSGDGVGEGEGGHGGPTGSVDLDLGCFYWTIHGDRGALQSVGSSGLEAPSVQTAAGDPLLRLSSDEFEGGGDGERLVVERPGDISFLVLHTSIYRGAADFREVGARVSVETGSRSITEVVLGSPAPGLDWCAVLVLGISGSRLHLANEERYFRSAFHADRHYGLGLRWEMGRKPD
ncbi:MAG: hypothetical protein AAFO29_02750 [Actinomycetota bacterium]